MFDRKKPLQLPSGVVVSARFPWDLKHLKIVNDVTLDLGPNPNPRTSRRNINPTEHLEINLFQL